MSVWGTSGVPLGTWETSGVLLGIVGTSGVFGVPVESLGFLWGTLGNAQGHTSCDTPYVLVTPRLGYPGQPTQPGLPGATHPARVTHPPSRGYPGHRSVCWG